MSDTTVIDPIEFGAADEGVLKASLNETTLTGIARTEAPITNGGGAGDSGGTDNPGSE